MRASAASRAEGRLADGKGVGGGYSVGDGYRQGIGGTGSAAQPTAAPAGVIERVSRAVILGSLRRVRQGRLRIRLPDGSTRCFGGAEPGPGATITVHDPRFFRRMLLDGEVGAGEAYIRGEWSVDSPMDAVRLGILNRRFFRLMAPLLWPAAAATWLAHRARANTVSGSRRNIADHYDLGNDFFALFLDPSMTYSCAYIDDGVLAADTRADRGSWAMTGKPGRAAGSDELEGTEPPTDAQRIPDGRRIDMKTLERAQLAKYCRLAAKAGLRPGRHVLEIGCGWGGFAEVAASEFGCRVTAVTISRAQASYARERIARAGLADRVSIELVDYREITGVYDCVVSIEMLEAVGHRFLPEFFRKCDEVLAPGGRAVLQVITIPDNRYLRYRMRPDYIQRFIFPGAHLPSLGAMGRALGGTTLRIADREDLAPHYGPTLAAWRQRLLEQRNAVCGLGFDEAFVRRWEFYFAYCEAAFRTRYVADWQLVLERNGRAHK
ncbi:MAG: cyclopropane-fatty-acyl-phospholipid synthase [Gemmatimonadota bacterium]|nr:cyclopropane-fatty-acyl-phospholipid synthase [Gemmatimonadota bacterium]